MRNSGWQEHLAGCQLRCILGGCIETKTESYVANVLLVEDDDQVRVLAESYLEEQGHTVWTAATADGAFAILNSSRPIDLLFTDIGLKEEVHGGIDVARRAVELRPGLKVLYTTGRAITDGMRVRFVEGCAVLPKPYTTEHLLHTLAAHFGISPEAGEKIN